LTKLELIVTTAEGVAKKDVTVKHPSGGQSQPASAKEGKTKPGELVRESSLTIWANLPEVRSRQNVFSVMALPPFDTNKKFPPANRRK